MYIAVDSNRLVLVRIVSFGLYLEVGDEIMATVDFFDAVDDVAVKELMNFSGLLHLLSLEFRAFCRQFVNPPVQLVRISV
jgi:hypothetical protein